MKTTLYLKSQGGKYHATALYVDGLIKVRKGSVVNTTLADHIRGGNKARSYLENRDYVDELGVELKDCEFKSPSTAAQFVTGNSTNGNIAWKDKEGKKLKELLVEK